MTFDPDAAAQPGSGIFGLPFTRRDSRIILLPIPFDATTSYGGGTSAGPAAILAASAQVDLFDAQFGRPFQAGIFMQPIPARIARLSRQARALAKPIISRGGGGGSPRDARAIARINAAGETVNEFVYTETSKTLAEGKIPGLVGGDHSTPFGAIRSCAEHVAKKGGRKGSSRRAEGLSILQIDAHMDLRDAFEGFAWSHASIMHNVLTRIPQVTRLVQVGIRDFGEGEVAFARAQGQGPKARVHTHFDVDWSRRLEAGTKFDALCREAIKPLGQSVYVSFDIDGLDPSLCPHTGTPVPGGLSFNRAARLLELLANSGRTIIGFDLNEVCPGPNPREPEWDAAVGARMLYKLCGAAAVCPVR